MNRILYSLYKYVENKRVALIGEGVNQLSQQLALRGVSNQVFSTVSELKSLDQSFQAVVIIRPQHNSPFAWQVLSRMIVQQELYYFGEGAGGQCANDRFFKRLEPYIPNTRVRGQFTQLDQLTEEINQRCTHENPKESWRVYVKGNDRTFNSAVRKIGRCLYMVEGRGEVTTPVGVTRSTNTEAWVSLSKQHRKLFSDSHYDKDPVASLKAATEHARLYGRGYTGRTLQKQESVNKKNKVGIPGVRCVNFQQKGTNVRIYMFRISIPGQRNKDYSVYIGTENTYLSNWGEALKRASKLRQEVELEYIRNSVRPKVSAA